jgi:hypothetical protein
VGWNNVGVAGAEDCITLWSCAMETLVTAWRVQRHTASTRTSRQKVVRMVFTPVVMLRLCQSLLPTLLGRWHADLALPTDDTPSPCFLLVCLTLRTLPGLL